MGGPSPPRWLGALTRLPRFLLKQFVVHFEPLPPEGAPLPSLTIPEARDLALYRLRHWFLSSKAPGGPLKGLEASTPGGPQGYKPPAIWPSCVSLPEGAPPPHAAEVPEGLLRVQAVGHGTFLLQTRGPPGGPPAPLSILTDPFFSRRAGPWGRFGGKQQQEQRQRQQPKQQQRQQQPQEQREAKMLKPREGSSLRGCCSSLCLSLLFYGVYMFVWIYRYRYIDIYIVFYLIYLSSRSQKL